MAEPLQIWVKAAPDGKSRGNCPFCHKTLLGLHYKKVHFQEHTFDLRHKPKELLEMNPAGTVPVLKGVDGKIITESEGILDMLEHDVPEPSIAASPESKGIAVDLLKTGFGFLKNKDTTKDEELSKAMEAQLQQIEDRLSDGRAYLDGAKPNRVDFRIIPILYQLDTALPNFKQYHLKHPLIKAYLDRGMTSNFGAACYYPPSVNIEDWAAKLA